MNNLLVAQSGGPTAVINATLAGVLQGIQVTNQIDKVYGAKHGINGVISDELIDLSKVAKNSDALELLKNTPASALGSCRHNYLIGKTMIVNIRKYMRYLPNIILNTLFISAEMTLWTPFIN